MAAAFKEQAVEEYVDPRAQFSGDASAMLNAALIAEISSITSDEEAKGFFQAIGHRIAEMLPLGNAESGHEISSQINAFWRQTGWGRAVLTFDDEGIDIFQSGLPLLPFVDEQLGDDITAYILQGAYDGWFRSLGSGARLKTRVTRRSEGTIELRHGL